MRSGDPARTAFGLNEGTARLDELLRTSRKVTKSPRIATIGKMMFSAVRNMALIPPEASSDPRRLLVACQTLTTHAFVASTHRAPHYPQCTTQSGAPLLSLCFRSPHALSAIIPHHPPPPLYPLLYSQIPRDCRVPDRSKSLRKMVENRYCCHSQSRPCR